jgi:hypothetical protein
MASPYIGYALLAVGLLMLIFTFLLGYGVYQNVTAASMFPNANQKVSGSNLSAVVGSAIQNATAPLDSSIYTIISIVVLFLFASIGYKMAMLGIRLLEKSKSKENS